MRQRGRSGSAVNMTLVDGSEHYTNTYNGHGEVNTVNMCVRGRRRGGGGQRGSLNWHGKYMHHSFLKHWNTSHRPKV